MNYLRTPDIRFEGLADFDFTPRYLMVDDSQGGMLRVHYLDEGRSDAAPVLTAFGAEDKVMAGADQMFRKRLPGAAGQDHVVLAGAGHFLQEDVGDELADLVNGFIAHVLIRAGPIRSGAGRVQLTLPVGVNASCSANAASL